MIQPPLLGVVNAASAVSARTLTCRAPAVRRSCSMLSVYGVHGRTDAPVPQIAAARAERVRSLDPDIAGVEREGIAAFDAVPLEGLQEELRHGCIAVVRIEHINGLGPKPGALVHSPSGAVGRDGSSHRRLIDRLAFICYFCNQWENINGRFVDARCRAPPSTQGSSHFRRRADWALIPLFFVRSALGDRGFLRRRAGPSLLISCKNSGNSGARALGERIK